MTMAMAFMAFQVMNNQGNMSLGGLENMFNMEQGNSLGSTVMMMVAIFYFDTQNDSTINFFLLFLSYIYLEYFLTK